MKKFVKAIEVILEGMLWTGLAILVLLFLFGWALKASAYLSVMLVGCLLILFPLLYIFVWVDIHDSTKRGKMHGKIDN